MDKLFNAFIIPGAFKNGKLEVSICFELEIDHDVLTGKETDEQKILDWKQKILEFTKMSRFMNVNGQLQLKGGIPLTTVGKQQNSDDVDFLWANFLGYDTNSKVFKSRVKEKEKSYLSKAIDRSGLSVAPNPLKLTITDQGMVSNLSKGQLSAYEIVRSRRFPEDVDTMLKAIRLHPMIITSKLLEKSVIDGIDAAYQADVTVNENRFTPLERYAEQFVHDGITQFSASNLSTLDTVVQDRIKRLNKFQKIASSLVNEPSYIKEAIHKLSGIMPVRRFVSTILDFEVEIGSAIPTQLEVELSADNDHLDIYTSIKSAINFGFKTNITIDPLLQTIVPTPINDSLYDEFYEATLMKLNDKSRVITYDTESVQRNLVQAQENITKSQLYGNVALDKSKFEKSKRKITTDLSPKEKRDIQSYKIKREILNKAYVKLNNHVANLQTKGHQMVLTDTAWLKYDPKNPTTDSVFEHDILHGFVTYQRIKENGKVVSDWRSLNRITEYFGKKPQESLFKVTDLAVNVDSFVNSLVTDVNGTPELNGINNGFLFLYDGTTVSGRNPMRHYEREQETEEDQQSGNLLEFADKIDKFPAESTALFMATLPLLAEDYFPFNEKQKSKYVIARGFEFREKSDKKIIPGLKFSNTRTYEYVMAMQYLNGFSPINEQWLKKSEKDLKGFISNEVKFLRHDHIRQPIVSLAENIYSSGTKKLKPQFVGETPNDLVTRKGALLHNDECVRYLLPPPVPTFQTYLWYDFENEDSFSQSRNLSSDELLPYYGKYQCELKSSHEFNTEKNRSACKRNCTDYCGGTEQQPIYTGRLNYLPDPVVNGYKVKFFYDKDRTELAADELYPYKLSCPINHGVYPQLHAWTIRLVRTKPKGKYAKINNSTQEITIYVPDGKQIYAEFWPTYHKDFGCFEEELLSIGTVQKEYEGDMAFDQMHSSPLVVSFTSAIQKPLFAPEILDINFTRYQKNIPNRTARSVTATITLKFEHLNYWEEMQIQGTQPTGELELYGLWDDYSTNVKGPQKSIDAKRDKGFVFLGKYVFKNPEDSTALMPKKTQNLSGTIDDIATSELEAEVEFELDASFPIHYYTPSVYKVRNTSKYISYFEDVNASEMDRNEKEAFSRWSAETQKPLSGFGAVDYSKGIGIAKADYLFNNLKPSVPIIEKIIALIVRDDVKALQKVTYRERFRIYYHPSLMGKDGRLGIIVNDLQCVYKSQFIGYISHAGIDAVMDNFEDRLKLTANLLGKDNFNTSVYLEDNYIHNFVPKDDDVNSAPGEKIGLVSYSPEYDTEQRLWYVDIELKLKNKAGFDLHSPFVQLGLVSYQPYSANYAFQTGSVDDTASAYQNDLRLSDPIKADFFSIRPTRKFENPFVLYRHKCSDKFSLSGAVSSLYFKDEANKKSLKSEFVFCVEKRVHDDLWEIVPSRLFNKNYLLDFKLAGEGYVEAELRYHTLLTEIENLNLSYTDQTFEVQFKISYNKVLFGKHRIVIFEIECHNNLDLADLPSLLINGDVQNINGVRVINNFIFSKEDSV